MHTYVPVRRQKSGAKVLLFFDTHKKNARFFAFFRKNDTLILQICTMAEDKFAFIKYFL